MNDVHVNYKYPQDHLKLIGVYRWEAVNDTFVFHTMDHGIIVVPYMHVDDIHFLAEESEYITNLRIRLEKSENNDGLE